MTSKHPAIVFAASSLNTFMQTGKLKIGIPFMMQQVIPNHPEKLQYFFRSEYL